MKNKTVMVALAALMIGCAGPKPMVKSPTPQEVAVEQARQNDLWVLHQKDWLYFHLDPEDRVKDGYISYSECEGTWTYTRPNQRPLIWQDGKWMLAE